MAHQLNQFSTIHNEHAKPFRHMKEPGTIQRYFGIWRDLIYYSWRIYEGLERPGCCLTEFQKYVFEQCLAYEGSDKELAMKFSALLYQQNLPGSEFSSVLISYVAALALDEGGNSWQTPGTFNGKFSALIWCIQLLLFGEALERMDRIGSELGDTHL